MNIGDIILCFCSANNVAIKVNYIAEWKAYRIVMDDGYRRTSKVITDNELMTVYNANDLIKLVLNKMLAELKGE